MMIKRASTILRVTVSDTERVIDTRKLVFLDTETTGLDPDRHEIWDPAFIRDGKEYEYKFSPDLTRADPLALKIGHFYERTASLADEPRPSSSEARYLAEGIAHLLYGRHIVGACPSFDDAFLKRFMLVNGQARSTWHYHLIDVETLIAGKLGVQATLEERRAVTKGRCGASKRRRAPHGHRRCPMGPANVRGGHGQ
jgi:hypothetical protein